MIAAKVALLLLLHQLHPGWCFQHRPSEGVKRQSLRPGVRSNDNVVTTTSSARSAHPISSTSINTIHNDITQTDADVQLHHTLEQLGVRGIDARRGISVCTTPQSVAGRGAFWSPSSLAGSQEEAAAHQGDVLAYIPKTSILTLSNPASVASGNNKIDDEVLRVMEGFALLSATSSWPVAFTLYVNTVWQQNAAFQDWINLFLGPDPPICPPDNEKTGDEQIIYNEAIQNLASVANVSEEIAKEAMAARYNSYERDWKAAREWIADTTSKNSCINIDEGSFAKLYSILISRTANLGPTYQGGSESKASSVRGVIPLHDMINHPPLGTDHNVELFTVGELRKMLPDDQVKQLVCMVFENNNELDDKDLLLVARCEIFPGDELFLSYRNNHLKPMEEKERAWTTLQYGFLIQ